MSIEDLWETDLNIIPEYTWPYLKKTYNLSNRELEIVKLVCAGHTKAEEIAKIIHRDPGTVKVHFSNIYKKTHVNKKFHLFLGVYQTAQRLSQEPTEKT